MRTSQILAVAASYAATVSAVTGQLGDAAINLDNPAGAVYTASFVKGNVTGSVTASTDPNGVKFMVAFAGLPTSGGPFLYHLHVDPVPASGNCTGTLAHLDPYIRGEDVPCDASAPATCQVGDLSGKYGKINGTSLNATFVDPYVSLKPGIGAFFGNRSIVLHYSNKTRIACANFTMVGKAANNTSTSTSMIYTTPMPTVSPTGTTTRSTSAPLQTTNAADRLGMLPLGPTAGCAAFAMVMGWFML